MQKGKDLTLRLMIVDDSVESAETIVTALRNGGIAVRPSRPQNQEELANMLSGQIDLAILGQAQQIPMSALQTQIAGSGKDIPVILLAERIEENALVEAASHGVRAIALRNRPAHLLALVRSEWNDLQARRGLRRIEAQMRETERRCDALIASSRDPIAYVHEGMHIRANDAYLEMFGFESFDDVEGISLLDMIAAQYVDDFKQLLKAMSKGERRRRSTNSTRAAWKATPSRPRWNLPPPPTKASRASRWCSAAGRSSTRNWHAKSKTCVNATRSPVYSIVLPSWWRWNRPWRRPVVAKASRASC